MGNKRKQLIYDNSVRNPSSTNNWCLSSAWESFHASGNWDAFVILKAAARQPTWYSNHQICCTLQVGDTRAKPLCVSHPSVTGTLWQPPCSLPSTSQGTQLSRSQQQPALAISLEWQPHQPALSPQTQKKHPAIDRVSPAVDESRVCLIRACWCTEFIV